MHLRRTAPDVPASCDDAEAALHQRYASFPAGQQLTAAQQRAAPSRQVTEPSGQGGWKQTNSRQGACDPGQWGSLPPLAEEAAECDGAAGLEPSAYTPQELAAHLDKLKQEFRQICSTLLDGDTEATRQWGTAAVAVS